MFTVMTVTISMAMSTILMNYTRSLMKMEMPVTYTRTLRTRMIVRFRTPRTRMIVMMGLITIKWFPELFPSNCVSRCGKQSQTTKEKQILFHLNSHSTIISVSAAIRFIS
jgi:hypothetical protein